MFLFLVCMLSGFVLGSVEVHNVNVSEVHSSSEIIEGEINLTIIDERYDAKITSNDYDEISLGEFLDLSGMDFECSPFSCLEGYEEAGEITDGSFDVPASGRKTVGFVLAGADVNITSLSFEIKSDFGKSYRTPLKIEFFERYFWEFETFSDVFLSKQWGCYDRLEGVQGPPIGEPLYCEIISIPSTGQLKVGAEVVILESEDADLTMSVYSEDDISGSSEECEFNPSEGDIGCVVLGPFSAGDYRVCVSSGSTTNYRIYDEDVGEICGFVFSEGSGSSTKDYAIFAQAAKYADYNSLNSAEFNSESLNDYLIEDANELIEERYGGDCSEGCVLPLSFSGVSQNVQISDVELGYTDGGDVGGEDTDGVYNLSVTSVTVDFDGVLDLKWLGFSVSRSMNYFVELGTVELFNKRVDIPSVPKILSVLPLNPPAGVPIRFYAKVNFSGNDSLSYKWDFGDGDIETTNEPNVSHSYTDLGNYTLSLEVSAGWDLVSNKSFNVTAISPEAAVDINLISRRSALDGIIMRFDDFSFWYKGALSDIVNITFFDAELNKLIRAKNDASSDQDFVDIAGELYALNVPIRIGINNFVGFSLMSKVGDVDVEPVSMIAGSVDGENNAEYAEPILSWQNQNINVSFEKKEISIFLWNGDSNGIFNAYSFNVSSEADEKSYFVINMPLDELTFKSSVGAKEAGGFTVITLDANDDSSFEFYYEGSDPILFFVSPKLSSIVIEGRIDTTCNYNFVCEEEYGENFINCRSDCKPVLDAIIYVILVLAFMLIIYTILQVWYRRRYERYLFKDDRQLYNLLMYVTNARARDMKDSRIAAVLRERGWSSERVSYIIKKSRGKRTGLVEIIPIEKVAAFFRNKKARNVQAAKVVAKGALPAGRPGGNKIATGNRQQMGRNINKSNFQGRV